MNNNILLIKKFLTNSDDKKLFINQLDEKIDQLYYYIISYFSEKSEFELKAVDNEDTDLPQDNDLFGKQEVKLYKKIQSRKIDTLLENNAKAIFFVDYRNYKKFKDKYNAVNTYNYKIDIKYFLQNELKIDDQLLLNNITNNPQYIYSEIEKFLVNNRYENSVFNENLIDNLLVNRKDLYDIKNKPPTNLVEFYNLLKKEVNIKKFSFLTS